MGRRRKGRSSASRNPNAEVDASRDAYGSTGRHRTSSDGHRGRGRGGHDGWIDEESRAVCAPSGDFIEWT